MIEFIVSIFLAVLAGDLLYLYHVGEWCESTRWIEVSEFLFLWMLVVGGLVNSIRCVIILSRRLK